MDAATSESTLARTQPETAIDHAPRVRRIATLLAAIALVAMLGYSADLLLHDHEESDGLLKPGSVALLMVGNLVPAIVLIVLLTRRLAMKRGIEQVGSGKLHTRLVLLFSIIAAVPTILVASVASLLIQSGLEFWSSTDARDMLVSTVEVAESFSAAEQRDVAEETDVMAADLSIWLESMDVRSDDFAYVVEYNTLVRKLNASAVLRMEEGNIEPIVEILPFEGWLEEERLRSAQRDLPEGEVISMEVPGYIAMFTQIPNVENGYLLAFREIKGDLLSNIERADGVMSTYEGVVARSRTNQLRFNAALLLGSLLIVGLASFAALRLADRLARPLGQLVQAAGQVESGDFSARVPPQTTTDEIATLATAFNRMTEQIEDQTSALLSANDQLDLRRAFIEAVLGSVTAGVIAIDGADAILLVNRSAAILLGDEVEALEGQSLSTVSPELEEFLTGTQAEASVELNSVGGKRTLAVKRVRYEDGMVLTFDDVTDQLSDQRRAAWSDIARRIAHEIKNPLTPIQLAAERIQRRYGERIADGDDGTFPRLTETIVRQVGDLRRMVDEFSNFARMPKPTFRDEDIHDIARASLFLHEVAHPRISFAIHPNVGEVRMVCDRRQLAQALTNIVKNGVEAIEARRKTGAGNAEGDRIDLHVSRRDGSVLIELFDTGVGLPQERERLTEPYMTTRVRGTGLGLAIVKKIVEEHAGQIAFLDRNGGGTHVRMQFDADTLDTLADGEPGTKLTRSGDDREYDEEV